jgi:sugar phosphate permease
MTGGAVGQEVLGYIVEHAGWRTAMFTCGVVSAFLLILIVLLVRNRTAGGDAGDDHWPGAAEIKRLLLSAPIIANTIAGGLVASAGVAFGMLWGVSYFQHFHGMSLTAASLCGSFYFWGCLPGMLCFAWLCSRYERPTLLLALGAAGTGVTMALILFVLQGQAVQSVAMFVLGLFNSSYALAFTLVKDLAPKHLSGVAMGLTNMMIMGIGGLVFQQLIGVLAHSRGQGVPGAGALSVIIGAQVVALGILMVPGPKPAAG